MQHRPAKDSLIPFRLRSVANESPLAMADLDKMLTCTACLFPCLCVCVVCVPVCATSLCRAVWRLSAMYVYMSVLCVCIDRIICLPLVLLLFLPPHAPELLLPTLPHAVCIMSLIGPRPRVRGALPLLCSPRLWLSVQAAVGRLDWVAVCGLCCAHGRSLPQGWEGSRAGGRWMACRV